jgi:hypothetical protein
VAAAGGAEQVRGGLAGWAALVGGPVGGDVVHVLAPGQGGAPGERAAGLARQHGLADPVRGLVGVHGGPVVQVQDRGQREVQLGAAQPVADQLQGGRAEVLDPGDPGPGGQRRLAQVHIDRDPPPPTTTTTAAAAAGPGPGRCPTGSGTGSRTVRTGPTGSTVRCGTVPAVVVGTRLLVGVAVLAAVAAAVAALAVVAVVVAVVVRIIVVAVVAVVAVVVGWSGWSWW